MRKLVTFFLMASINLFSFALPSKFYIADTEYWFEIKNQQLYNDAGEFIANIQDESLYDINGVYVGTLIENETTISLNIIENDKAIINSDFDKDTGLITKAVSYVDGIIEDITIFEYDKAKLSKISLFDSENSLIGYKQFFYDKKNGNRIKTASYNSDSKLEKLEFYDNRIGKIVKSQEFYENGKIRSQTNYDKNSEKPIDRLVYSESSMMPEKWTFIQFNEDGKYSLSDVFYLSASMCNYWDIVEDAEKAQDASVDWNENYTAVVRKYDFSPKDDGYAYIMKLKENRYLSLYSFTLCNQILNKLYCFTTDDNDEIDIASCYEIELKKKAFDYSIYKKNKGSGTFGFDIGMTYEEVKEACGGSEPEHIADNRYIVKPKKAHPLFEKYVVWISDSVGLYYIKGISRDISTTSYGTELKNKFTDLIVSLEKKYGKFIITDTIKPDYYLKDNQYWMSALRDGARTYKADWNATKDNYKDYNGIMSISVGAQAEYSTSGYIWIEYAFLNAPEAYQEKDDVL